ncbi:MAG: GTPase HflX [Verrucomicrobia bacterium]|nr:GTPase HflX [Verrucomicrobiota bacterium]
MEEGLFTLGTPKSALVVGIYPSGKSMDTCLEHLDELKALGTTYGFLEITALPCPIKELNARTLIGKGKVEEIAERVVKENIEIVIFDHEITPNQQKNLEEVIKRPVIDRTELILEIFAKRAHSNEATLQIELAKGRYLLPRLRRMWTHLERQRTAGGGAGSGSMRGAGETQLEVDRRILKDRISSLEHEIEDIRKVRDIQRSLRLSTGIPTFAIVGYTNVGKSTLLNALTEAEVLMEDKLFATLDTTSRQYVLPNKQKILLIDTVGFIRKLPHTLVAAFRSTLEESLYTDILLHLVDVSHPAALEQAEATLQVLEGLGIKDKIIITVLNKVDRCTTPEMLDRFRLTYPRTVAISALHKTGFDELLALMIEAISALRKVMHLRIPQSNFALAAELMREGRIISSDYEGNDILLDIEIPAKLSHKAAPFERT